MEEIEIPVKDAILKAFLNIPKRAKGIVLFAHGSGSGRHSPRNQAVAKTLRDGGIATLLMDLLTPEEENIDMRTRHLRFDIPFLAERLRGATSWVESQNTTKALSIGYFGASTGAAAALVASTIHGNQNIKAIVSRGGRPDLAAASLPKVKAPTLLIVGGNDTDVILMNQQAFDLLRTEKKMEIVPGATHLFEEPGTLEQVSSLARKWFTRFL